MKFLPFKRNDDAIGYGALPAPDPELKNTQQLVSFYDKMFSSLVQELSETGAPPLDEKGTTALTELRKQAQKANTAEKALVILQLFRNGAASKGATITASYVLKAEQYVQSTKDTFGKGAGLPIWAWILIGGVAIFGGRQIYKKYQE